MGKSPVLWELLPELRSSSPPSDPGLPRSRPRCPSKPPSLRSCPSTLVPFRAGRWPACQGCIHRHLEGATNGSSIFRQNLRTSGGAVGQRSRLDDSGARMILGRTTGGCCGRGAALTCATALRHHRAVGLNAFADALCKPPLVRSETLGTPDSEVWGGTGVHASAR